MSTMNSVRVKHAVYDSREWERERGRGSRSRTTIVREPSAEKRRAETRAFKTTVAVVSIAITLGCYVINVAGVLTCCNVAVAVAIDRQRRHRGASETIICRWNHMHESRVTRYTYMHISGLIELVNKTVHPIIWRRLSRQFLRIARESENWFLTRRHRGIVAWGICNCLYWHPTYVSLVIYLTPCASYVYRLAEIPRCSQCHTLN